MLEKINRQEINFFDSVLLHLLDKDVLNFPYIIYLDRKKDIVHYMLFQQEITFIQVIIQWKSWNQKKSIEILGKYLKKRKNVNIYIKQVHKIIQFHLMLYENEESFIRMESSFIHEKKLPVPYKVVCINLYGLKEKDNLVSEYESLFKLTDFFSNYFS